ncbi:MAG: alpha/beta hydrolase-fold protein [Gaiellaceae bacterium]
MTTQAFPARRGARTGALLLVGILIAAFLVVGGIGVYRYALNYWLYRGFSPPKQRPGALQHIFIRSPALGGRRQGAYVYLPPGYVKHPQQRYPTLYLLHGFPGRPDAFVLTIRAGVLDDRLSVRGLIRPMILVMPFGSTGTFTDKEWANGIRPHEAWATFVSRDLVRAIDGRYRTIRAGRGRAIAGLSEGGYGALNIALHHPGEFRVVESWSGYQRADDLKAIFGDRQSLLTANSPLDQLAKAAPSLRRARTYFWFYAGRDDRRLLTQNTAFAAELTRYRIPHRFLLLSGGHNWALWRAKASLAMREASYHLGRG